MRKAALVAAMFASVSFLALTHSPKAHAATQSSVQNATQTTQGKPTKPATRTVTVQSGDYLAKIAQAVGSTYQRIFYANTQVQDPNLIYPGQKLRIPAKDEKLTPRPIPGKATPAPSEATQAVASPAPTRNPQPTVTTAPVVGTSVWDRLAQCESGGNWGINTGNGFYGGLQFTLSSWRAVGGSGYPNQASREEQIARGKQLLTRQGWGAWPACSAQLGLS